MVADLTIGPGRNMLNMSGNMKRTRKILPHGCGYNNRSRQEHAEYERKHEENKEVLTSWLLI